ncbi:MAG: hypothetical protein HN833_00005 [Elusimicrobiaceae bacterium]|jgi:TolB protein|nr:hypothetical protein [Elusimicrobiaceae bacterium]MBT4008192.1 hypothetical protein [Elusimicrobiaceae bacterium]MBT4402508.1 hypothetical protein [Elusimicrobiaceae bacterium]MBT4439635.1 hypothetical protein [Elusimicrobiaceae bacterium]MBT5988071.1 hypothetical protein [Elusimicrobiaceae bacterium]
MIKKIIIPLICFSFLISGSLCVLHAESDVYIGLNSADIKNEKLNIVLTSFKGEKKASRQTTKEVSEIVRADLLFSRYFEINDSSKKIKRSKTMEMLEKFNSLGAGYTLVVFTESQQKELFVYAYLYENTNKKTIFARRYKSMLNSIRKSSHMLADDVLKTLTGKRGIATTRVVFANDFTGNKEIYIVDYDGKNLTRLTSDKNIALLPRWSYDSRKIYYTTYKYGNPDIFVVDLVRKKIAPVSMFSGLNLIGGVSSDDKNIVMTLSKGGGNTDIYTLNLENKNVKRLTSDYYVNGSPSFSPDGKFITYVSNRAGNPQIFIMELETGTTRKLTSMNWADSPQWSPTGEWIVFAGRYNKLHPIDIFLVDITGTRVVRLTSDEGSNEDPTWSPDGRFISFSTTRNGKRQLFVMDADGSAPHIIADLNGNTYTPNWSH